MSQGGAPLRPWFTIPFTGFPPLPVETAPKAAITDVHVPEDISEEAVGREFVPDLSYRQLLIYYHTPEGIVTRDGEQLTFPDSDEPQMVHAINYRADPTGNRIPPLEGDRILEESFYNSWVNGDPGGGRSEPEFG